MSAQSKPAFDALEAFDGLESLITRTAKFTDLVALLVAEEMENPVKDHQGKHFKVWEFKGELLTFIAEEAKRCANELDDRWIVLHNARCRAEREQARR